MLVSSGAERKCSFMFIFGLANFEPYVTIGKTSGVRFGGTWSMADGKSFQTYFLLLLHFCVVPLVAQILHTLPFQTLAIACSLILHKSSVH